MELSQNLVKCFNPKLILLIWVGIVAITVPHADGYSGGAPTSNSICESMVPGHGTDPQSSPSPYTVTVNKNAVNGGDKVIVTIASGSSGLPFKGFLVRGAPKNFEKDKSLKGTFIREIKADGADSMSQITDCSEVQGSSVTHTNALPKKEVQFEWEAPNEDAEFVLLTTFVENISTFWTSQPSEVIKVTRNANLIRAVTTPAPAGPSADVQQKLEGIYENCGNGKAAISKGCFGLPDNCIANKNCEMVVTYRPDGENGYKFELAGKTSSYVAVGLSKDGVMGEDSVIGCRTDGRSVIVGEYFNTKSKSNRGVSRTPASSLISLAKGSSEDGYIMCEFNLKSNYNVPAATGKGIEMDFDLANERLHLLLSRGTNSATDYLGKHAAVSDRGATPDILKLAEARAVSGGKSNIYIQLHGAFMIFAWLLCASTGMFTARYFKQSYTDSKPCGVAIWFAIHRACMTLTILLTVAAFVLIFVEVQDYTANPTNAIAEYYHPILGIVLTGLALMQVMIAFCRCMPNSKHRYLFNWFHWLVGNAAHIIGIACIFLANDLSKTNLKDQPRFWIVLVAFVAFHIILHIVMSIHTLRVDKQMEIRSKKRAVLPGPMKFSGMDVEAPGTGFRSAILAIYFLGAATTASVLVYFFIEKLP